MEEHITTKNSFQNDSLIKGEKIRKKSLIKIIGKITLFFLLFLTTLFKISIYALLLHFIIAL